MTRSFIFGIHGFIGQRLAEYLVEKGHAVSGMARSASPYFTKKFPSVPVILGDILDREKVSACLRENKPDYVFHLAAQSSPQLSWEQPELTFEINVHGTLNILDAVRHCGVSPVLEMFLSSSEYATGDSGKPIREDHPLDPSSPYGVSKVAAGQLSVLYGKRYGLRIVRVRPFFLIGPGKKDDVSSRFCRQIAAVERGAEAVMKTGNLSVVRDFLDIRDGVEALWLAASKGEAGQVYNIASGQPCSVESLLQHYLAHAKVPVKTQTDPALFRALDEPYKVGDVTRLKALGWKARYTLDDTTHGILEYWRQAGFQKSEV